MLMYMFLLHSIFSVSNMLTLRKWMYSQSIFSIIYLKLIDNSYSCAKIIYYDISNRSSNLSDYRKLL